MQVISRSTWIFAGLLLVCLLLDIYCQWRTGCVPHWLRTVHAAQDSAVSFTPDPCQIWREMPLLDKLAAFGTLIFGSAFVISLVQDVVAWFKRRKVLSEA
jgi:hypothetical protein